MVRRSSVLPVSQQYLSSTAVSAVYHPCLTIMGTCAFVCPSLVLKKPASQHQIEWLSLGRRHCSTGLTLGRWNCGWLVRPCLLNEPRPQYRSGLSLRRGGTLLLRVLRSCGSGQSTSRVKKTQSGGMKRKSTINFGSFESRTWHQRA